MHLVFPPLFPSGLLKSKIPPTNFEVCKRVGVFLFLFFLYCKQRFLHLQRLQSRCFRRHVALFRPCFRLLFHPLRCASGVGAVVSHLVLQHKPPPPVVLQLRGRAGDKDG